MIGIALQFLTGGFTKALAWITASARNILIAALVASLAWGAIERHGRHKAQKVLASTVVAWKAAEREATAAQIAANSAQQARWAQQARNVDHDYQKARVDADSRSERFIAVNRVRACATGPASQSDPAAQGNSAQGSDGAGQPAILVAVKPEDVNICTENTMRLQSAREWALTLGD
jgi:hypothetical protein